MQSPGDSGPCGSAAHWPVVALQLYITGIGAGVGEHVGYLGMGAYWFIGYCFKSQPMNVTVVFPCWSALKTSFPLCCKLRN